MTILRHLGLVLILLLSAARGARAQDGFSAVFTADRGALLIGEPVTLTLTVEAPAGAVVSLPAFPEHWPPFTVISAGEISTAAGDGSTIYRQELTVTLWQTGDYQTPETLVEYRLPDSDDVFRLRVLPVFFIVRSVLSPDDLALRPLKPPESLPYLPPWVALAAGVGALAAAAGGGRWFVRRRKAALAARASSTLSASGAALRELRRISGLGLPPFRLYPLIGDCLRQFVEARFYVPAGELTTQELMAALQSLPELTDAQRRELQRLLERVDLVKFARMQPEADAAQKLIRAASRWLESLSDGNGGPA